MFPSLKLGRPFGISLYVHWSFWLLPFWVWLRSDPETDIIPIPLQIVLIFALFGCVVLHELGHSLTARRFGIRTRRIVLSPLGGLAQLERSDWTPREEFWIAVAGPAVNVVIASVLGLLLLLADTFLPGWTATRPGMFVQLLLALNLMMVVFNLLPAFPMDGGRVLRALLAGLTGRRVAATRTAVLIGGVVALLFGAFGVLVLHNPWLLVIAAFVLWAGFRELRALEAEEREHAEEVPTVVPVVPVASTPRWPDLRPLVLVWVWDAGRGLWVLQPPR